MRGKLIVFEGVEGVGKTTQIQQIHRWLETRYSNHAQSIMTTRQPGGTNLGKSLRKLLLESDSGEPISDRAELLMYAADRAQHVENFIQPNLEQGAIILCDRFTDSTIAYQGYGRGLDVKLIEQLNQIATDGLQSDVTFWLDLDVEVGLARSKARGSLDRMERAEINFHRQVERGFQALAHAHPQRIIRIDASLTPDEVTQEIQAVLSRCLESWEL